MYCPWVDCCSGSLLWKVKRAALKLRAVIWFNVCHYCWHIFLRSSHLKLLLNLDVLRPVRNRETIDGDCTSVSHTEACLRGETLQYSMSDSLRKKCSIVPWRRYEVRLHRAATAVPKFACSWVRGGDRKWEALPLGCWHSAGETWCGSACGNFHVRMAGKCFHRFSPKV